MRKLIIKFGYSSSKKFGIAVNIASSFSCYKLKMVAGEEFHFLRFNLDEYFNESNKIIKLLEIISTWVNSEIYLENKILNGATLHQFISTTRCLHRRKDKNHCLNVAEASNRDCFFPKVPSGAGWGCRYITSIYKVAYPRSYGFTPGKGLYWFEHGRIEENKWIIDKVQILNRIKSEIYEKNLNYCPVFDENVIESNIKKLPDFLPIGNDWVFWNPHLKQISNSYEEGRNFLVPIGYAKKIINEDAKDKAQEPARIKAKLERIKEREKIESESNRKIENNLLLISQKFKNAKRNIDFFKLIQDRLYSEDSPEEIVSRFQRCNYDFSKITSIKHRDEQIRKKIRNYHDEMIIFLGWFSFKNYKPLLVNKVFNLHYKRIGGDLSDYYGWLGHGPLNKNGKLIKKSYFGYIIQALVLGVAEYYVLNMDFIRLEKHLIRFRKNINDSHLERYAIIISEMLKRDPHPSILAHVICGNYNINISNYSSLAYGFTITDLEREYLKNKKLKLLSNGLIDSCIDILKSKRNDWFLKLYLKSNPVGVLKNYEEKLFEFLSLPEFVDYPSWHHFKKFGVPSSSEGRGRRFKEFQKYSDIFLELRNHVRRFLGLPNISEGWIGETKLLYKLRKWFPHENIVHQWSPDWLGRQRIDIGFPDRSIAIEYHGTQHFEPVDFFGGVEGFKDQRKRDKLKAMLCLENNVKLLIFTKDSKDEEIKEFVTKCLLKLRYRSRP